MSRALPQKISALARFQFSATLSPELISRWHVTVTLERSLLQRAQRDLTAAGSSSAAPPASAIRDEGVSHHYLLPDAEAKPSAEFTETIARALTRWSARFQRGATWTIDTPYRETIDEVRV